MGIRAGIPRPATFGGVVNPFLRGGNSAAIGGDPLEHLMPQPRMRPQPPTLASPADNFAPPGLGPMGAPPAAAASAMPMPQRQPGGGFMATAKGGLQDFLGGDASMAMAAGLLGGGSTMNAIGRGFAGAGQAMAGQRKERAASEQLNRTADYFRNMGRDDLAEMTLAGGSDEAFKALQGGDPTSDMQEYQYAVEQGFQGSFTDYQMAMKKAGAQSIMVGDNMKLTEGQSKDVGFYARGRSADIELAPFENQLTSLAGSAASQIPLGNYAQTPEYQQAERAGREVLAVILRKDTGAAVTKEEFALYGPMYLPQPGDDATTVKAKKKARAGALAAIKLGLGTARPLADQIDAELGPTSDAPDSPESPTSDYDRAMEELRRRGEL